MFPENSTYSFWCSLYLGCRNVNVLLARLSDVACCRNITIMLFVCFDIYRLIWILSECVGSPGVSYRCRITYQPYKSVLIALFLCSIGVKGVCGTRNQGKPGKVRDFFGLGYQGKVKEFWGKYQKAGNFVNSWSKTSVNNFDWKCFCMFLKHVYIWSNSDFSENCLTYVSEDSKKKKSKKTSNHFICLRNSVVPYKIYVNNDNGFWHHTSHG